MMRTFALCCFFLVSLMTEAASQAREELNFGFVGANYEIPVHRDITIAPGAATNFDLNWLTIGVRANYYFDNLLGLHDPAWDVYGGIGAGYAIYNGNEGRQNDLDLGLLVGGRWFWNHKWGIYLEFGGGNIQGVIGGIGVTTKL